MKPSLKKKKQHGVTVLLLTVTLLLISMLLILFAAQYSALQQRISADLYRNQQAFEAAQAGLEAAIPYFQTNSSLIEAAASGGYLTAYMNSSTQNVALANGSQYTFVFSNPTANNYQLITVTSTGVNAEGTSTRVIRQQIQAYTTGMTPPTVSLGIQGSVTLDNSASINNTSTNSNIIAGGNITFYNSSNTTTSSGITSDSAKLGSDVQENQSSISSMSSSAYFQSVFGVSLATAEAAASYTYTNSSSTSYNSLNGITGAVIVINQTGGTASINNSTVIGSAARPVILLVNGNLQLNNSVVIYGLVFVYNPTTATQLNNSATVNGAISSTGSVVLNNSGTLNYNTSILNALPSVSSGSGGSSTVYAKVAGSWRDF